MLMRNMLYVKAKVMLVPDKACYDDVPVQDLVQLGNNLNNLKSVLE